MKQTAVEWLKEQLLKKDVYTSTTELFEQAKAMEKEQIMDAYRTRWINYLPDKDSEQYYNETFKQQEDETDSI